jgi:hypothetical protein
MIGLFFSMFSQASELLCASKSGETIYYADGQIKITAQVNSPTHLSRLSLHISDGNVGFSNEDVRGQVRGNWVRFQASDAWCDYTIVMPRTFRVRTSFKMFLDARCDENTNSSHRLNCRMN